MNSGTKDSFHAGASSPTAPTSRELFRSQHQPFYPRTTTYPGLTAIGVTNNTANRTVEYRLPRPGARSLAKEVAVQHATGLVWKLPADWQMNSYVSYSYDSAVSGLGGEQINNKTLPVVLADSNPATALNVLRRHQ